MKIRTRHTLFRALIGIGVVVFLVSLYDMFLNDSAWQAQVFLAYVVLIVLALILYLGYKPKVAEEVVSPAPEGEPLSEPYPGLAPAVEDITVVEVEEVPKVRPPILHAPVSARHSFKCPYCSNVFGLEASHERRQRDFRIACPFCENSIRIPKRPKVAPGDVRALGSAAPSDRALYACQNCGETLQFTAPGSRLGRALRVMTCPNCNSRQVARATPA